MIGKHSKETIEKMRASHLGIKNSEEAKRKMSLSHMGLKQSPETIAKRLAHKVGYKHSEETKSKIRKGNIGKSVTEETKCKLRISHLGHITSEETKKKLREILSGDKNPLYGKHLSVERKNKISNSKKGSVLSQETKNKLKEIRSKTEFRNNMSQRIKQFWLALSDKEKEQRTINATKARIKVLHIKPNKPETFIGDLLDKMYPSQYEYTGDGKIVIGSKCPDFYNEEQHKVILFHGIYWHLLKYQKTNPNLTKNEVEIKDKEYYSNYGYNTLIIWEDEISDINTVLYKISQFHTSKVAIGEKPITICEAEIASGVLPKIGGDMIV